MIIDLRTVSHEPRSLDLVFEPSWWVSDEKDGPILGLAGPLAVSAKVYRAGDKFVLDGRLAGSISLVCDRCLEGYFQEVKSEFKLFYVLPLSNAEGTEVELLEENMAVDFVSAGELDLSEVVREQIYLSLPMKSVCCPDCLGLCLRCGANLNKGSCACPRKEGHPAFSKLENLKI